MLRLIIFLAAVIGVALGVTRFADSPGVVSLNWLGYEIETSVIAAICALILLLALVYLLWSAVRFILSRPAVIAGHLRHRKEKLGFEALSRGLIAVGAGDKEEAQKFAGIARRRLPDEPLTGLLRAQTAQLRGDRSEARRIFEAMATRPKTELLGLRGLFLEAKRENELEAARQFAGRAMERDPDLAWSVTALFDLQCSARDWDGAMKTLEVARRHKQVDRETAGRRLAVLLTAQAKEAEESDIDRARDLALEANKLAPGLVPAAEIASRLLVTQDNVSRAGRILAKAWELSPHPDLALAYAHLRPGDSPRDRLRRVKALAAHAPGSVEGPIAVANAAVEARGWDEARSALMPLLDHEPSARVCTLMARIEGGEHGDQGRVREWLARALRAPRDPAWTADGFVSTEWLPVSPVTGELDAFEWKTPLEADGQLLSGLGEEELARLTGGPEAVAAGGAGLQPDPGAPRKGDGEARSEVLVVEAAPAETEKPAKIASGPESAPARPGDSAAAVRQPSPSPDPVLRPAAGQLEESEAYVPPRAPDDPGPDAASVDPEESDYPAPKS